MSITDGVQAFAAFATTITAGAAFWISKRAHETAHAVASRDAAVTAHSLVIDLTTGDVAAARHILGSLRYGDNVQREGLSRAEVIRAFYTLSWCIERTAHAYQGLQGAVNSHVLDASRQSIDWHVGEILTNLAIVRPGLRMSDETAWQALTDRANDLDQGDKLNVDPATSPVRECTARIERMSAR